MLPAQKLSCIPKSSPAQHQASRFNEHVEVQRVVHHQSNTMTYHLSTTYLTFSRHWKLHVSNHQWFNSHTFERMRARTCSRLRNDFLCYTWTPNLASLKAHLTVELNINLYFSYRSCFVVVDAVPSRPWVARVIEGLLSWFGRSFGCPPLCLSFTSFLILTTND